MPDCLQAAIEYAGLGLPVIPVIGKGRLQLDWPKKASSDENIIIALWEAWGNGEANVGVKCGPHGAAGIVDLNCNGPEGEDVFRQVWDGESPVTWTYRARRGLHWWFRWREGLPAKARYFIGSGEPRPFEVITGNGNAYVIAPPSIADGVKRAWLPGLSPQECDLAELPDSVMAFLVNFENATSEDLKAGIITSSTKRPPKHWERIAKGVGKGTRNQDLASLLGRLLRTADLDDEGSLSAVYHSAAAVNEQNKPPLKEAEFRRTFDSIVQKERNRRAEGEQVEILKPSERARQPTLDMLRKKLGPHFMGVIQRGEEEDALFELVFNHEGERITVEIGKSEHVFMPTRVEHLLAARFAKLGYIFKVPTTRKAWRKYAHAIMRIADLVTIGTRDQQTLGWIQLYLSQIGLQYFDACGDVLLDDGEKVQWAVASFALKTGRFYLSTTDMVRVLNQYLGERTNEKELARRFSRLELEKDEVWKKIRGKVYKKRYWSGKLPEEITTVARFRSQYGVV